MKTGGRQAYFATARVDRIIPDPTFAEHFYAEVSGYLEFARPVPFKQDTFYYESALQKADGSTNKGAFGRAVRVLPEHEYDLIWRAGFGTIRVARRCIRIRYMRLQNAGMEVRLEDAGEFALLHLSVNMQRHRVWRQPVEMSTGIGLRTLQV